MRLHGVTIQIVVRTETGTDIFGHPIYAETTEDVENVLIGSPSFITASKEVIEAFNLDGKKVDYWLGIPKGDTHDWEDAKVILPAPFAGTYKVIRFPIAGIPDLVPMQWGMNVAVERYDGDD